MFLYISSPGLFILSSHLINFSVPDSFFYFCCGPVQSVLVCFCLEWSGLCCFRHAHPLWPGVLWGRSEQCVSHQVRQDAHWPPVADRSHPGQSAVGELTFSMPPWPWWEVKCVAGSSQHRHSGLMGRRWQSKRTRPEAGRFSWPVTPVPSSFWLSSCWAGFMTASPGCFTSRLTCRDQRSRFVTKTKIGQWNHLRHFQLHNIHFINACRQNGDNVLARVCVFICYENISWIAEFINKKKRSKTYSLDKDLQLINL